MAGLISLLQTESCISEDFEDLLSSRESNWESRDLVLSHRKLLGRTCAVSLCFMDGGLSPQVVDKDGLSSEALTTLLARDQL